MSLDKSIWSLDQSVASVQRGLIRSRAHPTGADSEYVEPMEITSTDVRRFLDTSGYNEKALNSSRYTSSLMLDSTVAEKSVSSMKRRTDHLYALFHDVLQGRTNEAEIFETILDLVQTCSDLNEEMVTARQRYSENGMHDEDLWLSNERDTWRLIYCLYRDRLMNGQNEIMDSDDMPLINKSEKGIIDRLYLTNANLREYQLIVDWLELCASEQKLDAMSNFTERRVAWENSLHELLNAGKTEFGSGRPIVRSLDPDAPFREKRPLHDLDVDDEERLAKQILVALRQGNLDKAQSLCEHCGQPWRAAILEGWRLHNDPNYEATANPMEKMPVAGNPRRDIWKRCAWKMADNKNIDEFSRATVAVFCGHLEALTAPFAESWCDLLWAHLKVQIDIRVEGEIRSCSMRSYTQMPDTYWNSRMSLEQIFDELAAHRNASVKNVANNLISVIQKYIILDNIPEMLRHINTCLDDSDTQLSAQTMRFFAHIVLFLRQIGRQYHEDIGDRIIKEYVECLIVMGDAQLVAYYTAALPPDVQICAYSKFLETVTESSARKKCLEEGVAAGLNVNAITTHTVVAMRCRQNTIGEPVPQQGEIFALDAERVSALEWLTFYPEQRGEMLWQANALIRTFMAEGKVDCVRHAINTIPTDSILVVVANYGTKDDLPAKEESSIKEYLCHQTYLAAIDGFNDWSHMYHGKPKEPLTLKSAANFTERVATEHKEQIHKAEVERWKSNLAEQTNLTKDLLYNVLLFPEKGWLVDVDSRHAIKPDDVEDFENRSVQLDALRKLCIPQVVLLLHKVLHLSGEYRDCIQLAIEVANEHRELYKAFTKQKMTELLAKFAESSLALMNDQLDPWGYERNA